MGFLYLEIGQLKKKRSLENLKFGVLAYVVLKEQKVIRKNKQVCSLSLH